MNLATAREPGTTLAQPFFVLPEIFAQEQNRIFANAWVLVAHQGSLSGAGDFLIAEVANESLIIVRDKRASIRAFYNVCRHRGTRMIENPCGQVSAIQCPYHAWSYSLDGRLVGAPHMEEIDGFDKANYGLRPVHVGLWEGFVFVNLAQAPVPIADWFAPLTTKFSNWNLSRLRCARRIAYDVAANWKLIFENYSECYHCPGVHPALSKLSPYDSAENDLDNGPILGGLMKIKAGRSLTMSGKECAIPIADQNHAHSHALARIPKSKTDDEQGKEYEKGKAGQVFYYSIFPNMLLSAHPDYVMVHRLRPQTPDRTLIECEWYFHPEAFERADFRPYDAVEFWDMTNKQDWHVCELSQQGISSRAYQPGPYSSRESIPAAWDEYYLGQMA